MAISIRPDEISNIIQQQIEQYDQQVKVQNVGTVLSVGDGIAESWLGKSYGWRVVRI